MSTFAEYTKKQKKKSVENTSFREYTKSVLGDSFEDDIAPVKSGGSKTESKKKDKKKSLLGNIELVKDDTIFDDGYQFGDVTKSAFANLGKFTTGVAKGALAPVEGISDLLLHGAAGLSGLVGADGLAEKLHNEANANSTQAMFAPVDKYIDKYSTMGRTLEAANEGLGQVVSLVGGGAALKSAGLGSNAISATTQTLLGASAAGSGISEAYQGGANDKEALKHGLNTGISAVMTEMLFGGLGKSVNAFGIGKGLSSADDILAKKLTGKINNVVARNAGQFAIKSGAEGVEEILDGVANAVSKKMTYMSEEDIKDIMADENLLESFVVGTLSSAAMQSGVVPGTKAGSLIEANKNKTDFITGYTDNEQKVIDKVVEERIAEREADGKKLTTKEKANIEEAVKKDLEKGYIDTDTIESVLGGETYEGYKSLSEKEKSLQEEIKTLQSDPRASAQTRLAEAKAELDKIEKGTEKTELKERLSSEVRNLAMSDRLLESYNEKSRKTQKFVADLSQYDEKAQMTVKKAVESGILNNTNRTHDFVDMVAKLSADKGVLFDFTNNENLKKSGFAIEGKTINGLVKDNDIILNIDSKKALNTVVGHEIAHVLEGTDLYSELQNAVKEYATIKGDYDSRLHEISALYKDVDGASIKAELTADLIGDYLFTDSDFISKLSTEKPNVFKKIFDEIKYLVKIATAGSKEARELEKVKKAFENAYKGNANFVPGEKLSLSSMGNTFFGNAEMTADEFEKADYKNSEGYRNYVDQCLNNYKQTRTDFNEEDARKEIESSIEGIVKVALAAKRAGYDIYDDNTKRDKRDSKDRLLFSSLEPNSDYFTSSDISTICDKRQNFAEIYDEIVRAEEEKGVPNEKRFFSNVDNYFYLHKVMADKGLTQPCRQCYVESMRKNLSPMANAFIKLVNEADANNKSNDQLYQQSGKTKGELKANNAKIRERVRELLGEYNIELNVETLTTEDGLAQLKIQAPLIYEAFNSFYGQSKPKMPKSATPFRFGELTALLTDEHGKIKKGLVDKINSTGGFRLQSYSDFQIQNYTDVLQVIFEAGTMGLNGHAYTKVPAFLEATEGTNLKRNISIFMYKDGNEWKIDKNDSFPYELEDIYNIVNSDESGNTGIIAVSQNEDMSAWIMANDNIGYGIPFHKSGLKMGVVRDTIVRENGREIKGYSGTKDHTKQQTEVWAKTNQDHKALTKVKKGINIYEFWDFDNKDNLSKNELIEKNVKAYIDACEEAGYLPKFREYVMNNAKVLNNVVKYSNELGNAPQDLTVDDISFSYKGYQIPYGYYKFLGDFGMFKPNGEASPQEVLSLNNYDFDKAANFFADAETLRRNEILQQFANGEERQKYRESGLSAEELSEIVRQKRKDVAEGVISKSVSRFSLSESVEETKDLIAVHNLNASELIKTIELGGLPMPSIAVIKAESGHDKYGDVSLVLPKESIDPKVNKANKVYGGDAWTPTYPKVEYKPSESVEKKISDKYYEFADKYGYDEARPLYRYVHELEDTLNREKGEAALLERLYNDTGMMQVFLQDTGKEKVQDVTTETVIKISEAEAEMNQYLVDVLGEDLIAGYKAPAGLNGIRHRKEYIAEHEAEIKEAYGRFFVDKFGFTEEQTNNVINNMSDTDCMKIIRNAYQYTQNNGVTVKTETDYEATKEAIRNAASDGYKEWVDNLFKGVEEKTGIRNNLSYYTNSGNARSWDALHWEENLENVVKAMKQQNQTGADAMFAAHSIFATAAKDYRSIADVKADSGRLYMESEEEYKKKQTEYQNRFSAIAEKIMDKNSYNKFTAKENAMEAIVDAVRKSKTKAGILKELKDYPQLTITDSDIEDIVTLVNDIGNMPTGYFEAKPQRAVSLDEVGVFIIPNNADAKLKQELLNRGYSIAEYDPNVEGDRNKVLNRFEEYKFSLADAGNAKTYGDYNVYGKDIRLEQSAPVEEQPIAPIGEQQSKEHFSLGDAEDAVESEEDGHIAGEDLTKKNAERIKVIQSEVKGYRLTKDVTNKEFADKIAKKEAEYEALQRKDTKKAMDLRNQITRLEARRDSLIKSLDGKIERANKRIESIENESRYVKRKSKQNQYRELFGRIMGDTSTWVDKKLGIQYQTNTLRRNLRDIVRDAGGKQDIARADAIYDELQGSVNRNEAKKNREANSLKNMFREMKINNTESTYIQMLGELRHNPDTTLTQDAVNEFYKKNKSKIDTKKVDNAIEEARKLYDSLYDRVNAALSEHGFKEMGYRKGYFPHFTDPKQNWLSKLLNWKVQNDEIPTDIAGLTELFEPQRTWQSFDKHRMSDSTDYNFLKGLDNYVNGALDWIYHIEDIQKHRAFETEIRYRHSSEAVQKKIDEYRNNPMLSTEEVESLIQNVLREAKNPLNNFVTDLHTRTNILAGKKSSKDRNMESDFNRHAYSVMTNVTNRVTANQVVGSISSAMTNFIPITQSWGQVNPTSSLVGMKKTIQSYMKDDGVIAKSDFLTNRLAMNEALYKDAWDKIGDKVGGLMEIADNFTSQTVWRSKYYENIKNGMAEAQAIKDADQFAENVIGGRSKGNQPTIFHAKNPVTKMLTSFQLEVSNQYGYMFKDMPQDIGKNALGKLTKGYATMFVGAYAYNALYSTLTGRDAAFDPIRIIEEFIGDLSGDDDEEENVADAIAGLASNVADEIPFVGGLLGGGRIPISSALPYNASISDAYADVVAGDWKSVMDEMSKPLYYGVLPMGGGQIRKTVQGLSMFDDDHPVSGSYTKSGNLRYPVEDTIANRFQAALFGQYSSSTAREYFDRGEAPLKEKQIQEYADLDMPIREYWDYRKGLKKQETLEDKFEYIADLDVSVEQKNIMINNIVDRKEKVDMSNYDDFANYEEFDFYAKNTEKYNFLQDNGVSYSEYASNKDAKEEYDNIYSWYKNNPEKVTVSKAVTDNVIEYKRITSALNDIRADKDANGDSIAGSAKVKKVDYINSLDLDYGQKIILLRSYYDGDKDKAAYNADIVEYLNSREDLSYEDIVTILEELDFKVYEDGTVEW